MDAERIRIIWESEIDRLELEVIRIERLVRGLVAAPTEPWSAPSVPGPIPEDMRERAISLLERQEIAQEALVLALAEAQKQAEYAERVAAVRGRTATDPIYLDLQA